MKIEEIEKIIGDKPIVHIGAESHRVYERVAIWYKKAFELVNETLEKHTELLEKEWEE